MSRANKHIDYALFKTFKQSFNSVLNKVDELRQLTKQNNDIKLPSVVVIGDQSHGKSSLLEMISGVNLPRGQGMMTRVPLEIRLRKLPQNQKNEYATISANVQQSNVKDGKKLDSVDDDEISKAIKEYTDIITDKNVIADIPIILTIFKERMPDLTLIDLPGLIRNPKSGEEKLPAQIREITEKYIKDEETIILNVLQANVDSTNCESLTLSKKYDPTLKRTLLILTKMDQCEDHGFEERFQKIHEDEGFKKEKIFLIRNRTNKENNEKISISDIYNKEEEYFNRREDLKNIPSSCIGIKPLIEYLVELQKERVINTVPNLEEKIQKAIKDCQEQLNKFGKKLSSQYDSVRQYYCLLGELFQRLQDEANGMNMLYNAQQTDSTTENYESKSNDDDVEDDQKNFIRSNKNVVQHEQKTENLNTLLCAEAVFSFEQYSNEIEKISTNQYILSGKFLEEILKKNKTRKGFTGLPHQIHPMIAVHMIDSFVEKLRPYSHGLIDDVYFKVAKKISKTIDQVYKDYPRLKQLLKDIFLENYDKDKERTVQKIDEVLQCELTYKYTMSKEYQNSMKQIQNLILNHNQISQNVNHPTVLKISNVSSDDAKGVNGVYYLRGLDKNGHVWYKHIDDVITIEWENNCWIIKKDQNWIAHSESYDKYPTSAANWKIKTSGKHNKDIEKTLNLSMETLSFHDVDSIEDKSILQCLDFDYKQKNSDSYFLLIGEAAKIAAYWKLVLNRIKDSVPVCVRYNLIHLPLSNARKDELDAQINNLQNSQSSSSSSSSSVPENIIWTLMCPDEKTMKQRSDCEKNLENLLKAKQIVRSMMI